MIKNDVKQAASMKAEAVAGASAEDVVRHHLAVVAANRLLFFWGYLWIRWKVQSAPIFFHINFIFGVPDDVSIGRLRADSALSRTRFRI